MGDPGISPTGTAALKQILWIRDNIDYEKYLLNGDPEKKIGAPLSGETLGIIKDPERGWPAALDLLLSNFNSNRNDVLLVARLFGIKVDKKNPILKARQLSETILNEPSGASDLSKAIKMVEKSRISGMGKAYLIQILFIRDNIDYEKFLLYGDPAKKKAPPLLPQTIATIKDPDKGWPAALGALVDLFHRDPKDIIQAAQLFNIKVDDKNPRLKARQISESPNGLNVKNDSTDLKSALCRVDHNECAGLPADDIFNEASRLLSQERYQQAINIYNKLPKNELLTFGAQYNLGFCYKEIGRKAEAISALKLAQKLGRSRKPPVDAKLFKMTAELIASLEKEPPTAPPASQPAPDLAAARDYFEKGAQAFQKGDYKSAAMYFGKAYAITKDPLLYYNIAQSKQRLGQKIEAVYYYNGYLIGVPDAEDRDRVKHIIREIEKDKDMVLAAQATAYMHAAEQSTDPKKREQHYRSALVVFFLIDESKRTDPSILYRMAVCYQLISDFGRALEYWQKGDSLGDEWSRSRAESAESIRLCKLGFSSAEKAEEAALKLKTEADALYKKGAYLDAIRKLIDARYLNPKNAAIHYSLGLALFTVKRFDLAEVSFKEVLSLNPQDVDALCKMGYLKQRAGDSKASLEFYKRASAAAPNNSDLQYLLYKAYAKMHDMENAVEAYSKASKLNPLTYPPKKTEQVLSDYNILYSEALAAANKKEKALAAAKAAVEHDPDSAPAHLNLGRRNLDLDKYQSAAADFSRVIKLKSAAKEEKAAAYEGRSKANQGLAKNYAISKNILKRALYKRYSAAAEADSKKANELGTESTPAPAPTPKPEPAPIPAPSAPSSKPAKTAAAQPPAMEKPVERKTHPDNARLLAKAFTEVASGNLNEAEKTSRQFRMDRSFSSEDLKKYTKLVHQLTLILVAEDLEIKGDLKSLNAAKSTYSKVVDLNKDEINKRIAALEKKIEANNLMRAEIFRAEQLEKRGKLADAKAIYLRFAEQNKELYERIKRIDKKVDINQEAADKKTRINSGKVAKTEEEHGIPNAEFLKQLSVLRKSVDELQLKATNRGKTMVGTVVFRIGVRPDGSVENVELKKNESKLPADFINQAIAAMKKWEFTKADRRTVAELPFVFKAEGMNAAAKTSEDNATSLKNIREAFSSGDLAEAEKNLAKIRSAELNVQAVRDYNKYKSAIAKWKTAFEIESEPDANPIDVRAAYDIKELFEIEPKYFRKKFKELDEKMKKMTEEQKKGCLSRLEDAVNRNPNDPALWTKLGEARLRNKKFTGAITAFGKSISFKGNLGVDNPANHYGEALAHHHLKSCIMAKVAYKKALEAEWITTGGKQRLYDNKPQPWLQSSCKQ